MSIPEDAILDLRNRLAQTRWADDLDNADWRYGVERSWLQDMVRYWREDYDWRATESEINRLSNFKVTIGDVPLHFVHMRGKGANPIPLLLVHGWPWTFMDFHDLIGPLCDPAANGGDIADSFDIIIPSLPGFGFSTPLCRNGYAVPQLAGLLCELMTKVLGYSRFAVAGGDWGAAIVARMAHEFPDHVIGMLATIPLLPGNNAMDIAPECYARDEQWMIARTNEARSSIQSHMAVHSLDPQTLAYALVDSPVGTAAWLWERRRAWSDCQGDLLSAYSRDFLCTLASIYWLTGTIGTSLRIYWENAHNLAAGEPTDSHMPVISVPSAFAIHPKEHILIPRSVAAENTNLQRWSIMPRGGHFSFSEQPQALVVELRDFFRPQRT